VFQLPKGLCNEINSAITCSSFWLPDDKFLKPFKFKCIYRFYPRFLNLKLLKQIERTIQKNRAFWQNKHRKRPTQNLGFIFNLYSHNITLGEKTNQSWTPCCNRGMRHAAQSSGGWGARRPSLCRKREQRGACACESRERKIEIRRHAQNIDRMENGQIKKSIFCFLVKHFSSQQNFWLL